MTPDGTDAVRRQLDRVLASSGFVRNDRLSRFLRMIVERHLDGRDAELKESVIAVEVFGRKPDYDSKLDSIVRTEAARLRARLVEYYAGEGRSDPLLIEVPKGGYIPVLRTIETVSDTAPETVQITAPPLSPPSPSKGKRWLAIPILVTLALISTAGWWMHRGVSPIRIAVLPLDNLTRDPANDYFADGLTDELITNLSLIEGLTVRSAASSLTLKGKHSSAREAGAQLQADYILEGAALRSGQKLRVNVRLVRVRDDSPLWSQTYDREVTDVFAIQDEISRHIVNNLRLKLGNGRRRYEASVDAYDLYLRARSLAIQRGPVGLAQSIELLEKAIAGDPSFAPAYAVLAEAYSFRSSLSNTKRHEDDLAKMRSAAEKALELDPLLASAHSAMAVSLTRQGQWNQAERSFRRAIELDHNRSETYGNYAITLLVPLGRIDQALQELALEQDLDPLSPEPHGNLAFVLCSAGRYKEVLGHCARMAAENPLRKQFMARARMAEGNFSEAIRLLGNGSEAGNRFPPASFGWLGYAYARSGHRDEAISLAQSDGRPANQQALIYAGLGDKDRTLEALDRMAPEGPQRVGQYLTYPELSLVRGDPRVKAIRQKVGLPE
jgi:TolB-like protein/Tfp pilus assembly protein PilF